MGHSTDLQNQLDRLSEGHEQTRRTIIDHCCERLRIMARRMLKKYPGVGRWSDTDDVLQESLLRLHRALVTVRPETNRKFYGLAATQIRRELLDLARRLYGSEGLGTNQKSGFHRVQQDPFEPESLTAWTDFHTHVEGLPEAEQEVFCLVWYDGLNQIEVSRVLGVSLATVKRRWQSARLILRSQLEGDELG